MFAGSGGIGWATTTRQIYNPNRLRRLFRDAFDEALKEDDVAPLLDFYAGETGAKVSRLEVGARRAIMSEDVEEAARAAYLRIEGDGSDRVALLEEFADLNDLIDQNVTGALNSSLAFYRGLGTGEGFELTEDQMLSEVWESTNRMEERIKTLERILDIEAPNWRSRQ